MPRPATLDVCTKYLYEDMVNVPEAYRDRLSRVRGGFTFWHEFPTKTRTQIRDHITARFGVVKSTAYEDIQVIEILLGNIKNPAKDWIRFKVNAMLEDAYRLAEAQEDPKAMALAAAHLGKYNLLDKPEAEPIPFDQIVPQTFDPSDDPTPLGMKKDPDIRAKKRKMLEKYMNEIEIIDVPYEEMINDGSEGNEENIL